MHTLHLAFFLLSYLFHSGHRPHLKFQPYVAMADQSTISAEMQTRMEHDGRISPPACLNSVALLSSSGERMCHL